MKVSFVHDYPIHYKDALFRELKALGLQFEVLYMASMSRLRTEKINPAPDAYASVTCFEGKYEGSPMLRRIGFTWRELTRVNPSIVVIHGYYAPECWMAWAWAHIHGRSSVLWYESNEFDMHRVWWKELPKKVFVAGLDAAHVFGKSSSAYLQKLGMLSRKIVIKGPPVLAENFRTARTQKLYSANGDKKLIYVGRLSIEKNLQFLLRALARAAEGGMSSNLRLTIVGSGPLEEELKQQSDNLGLCKVVTFLGYVQQKDLPNILRQHDFFVLPSTYEPYGLAALEAMLCRLPIIISTQCGCAADLATEQTGWTFSPWNLERLIKILRTLPSLTARQNYEMGDAAYNLAKDKTISNCAETVIRSLKEINGEILTFAVPGNTAE